MAEQKKSMDDVLASIRKIIKTDPNAAPPDASTLPPSLDPDDDTAQNVLERLRKDGADADDEPAPRALSGATDDPEETAKAVLEKLREETEKQKAVETKETGAKDAGAEETPAKTKAAKPAKAKPEPEPDPEAAAELPETPEEPPVVAADDAGVPVLDDEEPLELGAETSAQVLEPQKEPVAEPQSDLPKPAEPKAPAAAEDAPEPAIMIDEAALDDTIRRVVREELTGEMGRRMTKNVQRMIETEVNRLLAERDKD